MMVTIENYRRSRARARVGASTFISRASALTFSTASIRAACVGLACMLVLASSANAADILVSKLDSSGRAWVTFEGDIVLSDVLQFQQKTSNISKAIVVLDSDGGQLLAGIEVGKIIRLRNYMTLVPDNALCASACAIAWLGGTTRYMAAKARIGFHAAFNAETKQETGVGNALIGSYLSQIGLPDRASDLCNSSFAPVHDMAHHVRCAAEGNRSFPFRIASRSTPISRAPRTRPAKRPNRRVPAPPSQRAQPQSAVAQRAVLYDEDPADPKGKQYVGSVIWRTEQVKANVGRNVDIAVRADVDIPERKLKMTMSFRRNNDTSLPASHTAELTFVLPWDFAGGGVSNVPGILMKSNEQARGTPLAGLAVKVTDGFFMVGLSNVEADRQRNLQLLKERSWFDIPLVYTNQRRAIIAIERGAPGERAFKDAFAAWEPSHPTATTVQPEPDTGSQPRLSQSELDAMRARLASLWNVQPGVKHPEELYVTVRIRLNPDRRLAAPPQVVSTGSSPRYQEAADAAVRAVLHGQPYTMLRDETYEQWKYMDIDFDPKQMFRHPQRQRTKVIFWQPKTKNWT